MYKRQPPSAAPKATGHPSANRPKPQTAPAPSGPARAGNSKSAGGGNRKGPKAPEKPRDTTAQPQQAEPSGPAPPGPICNIGCFTGGTVVLTAEGERAIDEVELGSRVLVEADGLSCETEVDEAWVVVELEVELDDGGLLQMETLKPPSWLEENGAEEGSLVWVELEELGVAGEARVKNIRGPPAVAEGAGCVVLSRYQRVRSWLLEVELSSGERVEVTDNHLLYSETRDGWVQAGGLAVGEYVRGAYATLVVDAVEARPGSVEVFNLEVEGQHRYLVGRDGVVAHNAGGGGGRCGPVAGGGGSAFARGVPHGFKSQGQFRQFGEALQAGLQRSDFGGTIAHMQGSAVTGRSYRTGAAFDVGRVSDFDIALSGEKILDAARAIGVKVKTGGHTRPLAASQIDALGLRGTADRLSRMAGGREVNFMLFDAAETAVKKAPSFPIAGRF
ncbi:MAG: hypothetical protein KUG77_12705 [Nannocystaceae bacterium]|nr:hypothetical protein [Nannocystaceae bacterium]